MYGNTSYNVYIVKIGQTVAEITIFHFSRWLPSAIFDLWGTFWHHQRGVPGGLYHCAKFVWNCCSSLDNARLVWKRPFTPPKWGVWAILPVKYGSVSTDIQKAHLCTETHVIWRIDRQNRRNSCWYTPCPEKMGPICFRYNFDKVQQISTISGTIHADMSVNKKNYKKYHHYLYNTT